jgi:hypothetical protein
VNAKRTKDMINGANKAPIKTPQLCSVRYDSDIMSEGRKRAVSRENLVVSSEAAEGNWGLGYSGGCTKVGHTKDTDFQWQDGR